MKIKKNVIFGIVGIAVVIIVFLVIFMPKGEKIDVTEPEVDRYTEGVRIFDSTLEDLNEYVKNENLPNGVLLVDSALEGEGLEIILSSLAVRNIGIYYGWTTLLYSNHIVPGHVTGDELDSGEYHSTYMHISKVVVEADGEEHEAMLPKNKFFIDGNLLDIQPDEINYLKLTFINDNETVTKTVDGEYVYAPKINIQTYRDVTVEDDEVVNGTLWNDITVGMNIDGEVMSGYGLDFNKDIELVNGTLQYV